ncbi:MAG TPA: prolyl oligopeptidase family serine peptidase, partial [Gallionella sp.]|nr:prolyl oligopeptidase family serine peptidase [Gallionella sp.]
MKLPCLLLLISMLAGCTTTASHPNLKSAAGLPELIPVRDFVANRGSNFGYRISPDGKKLAWIAVKGVSLHFFIKDLERNTIHTLPAGNFYGDFAWAQDSRRLIFSLESGDENAAYATLDTEQADDHPQWVFISPWGVKAQFARTIPNDPAHVLIAHNQRDKTVFDLFRVNIDTFQQTLIAKNPGNVTGWLTTPQGELKGRIVKQEDASALEILQPDAVSYKPLYQWSSRDKVQFVSIADAGAKLYLLSNKNRDRLALIELATASGEEKLVYDAPLVDVSRIYAHPLTGEPLIANTEPGYPEAAILAPSLKASFGFLSNHPSARFNILGSDNLFHRLTLALSTDKGHEWYLYDVEHGQLEKLGSSPSLEHKDALADVKPIEIASRDNVPLHGYLTLPKGVPPHRLPMVLWVHGGPWARDDWQYNSEVQFLANRGYAVLQINYRGSTGYGRSF